jgi:cardiolipin synthase C
MNLDPRSATQTTELGVFVDSPELAREMLRVITITISKLQNSCRLKLAETTGDLHWHTNDGEKDVVLTSEPETGIFQRLLILFAAPFVPESLL